MIIKLVLLQEKNLKSAGRDEQKKLFDPHKILKKELFNSSFSRMNYSTSVLQVFVSGLPEIPPLVTFCFRCLCLNDAERWTAQQLLDHAFLKPPSPKTLPQDQETSPEGPLISQFGLVCGIIFQPNSTVLVRHFPRSSGGLCVVSHPPQLHPQRSVHFRDAEAVLSLF